MADAPPRALIVAGPTCSGKSALALALAERFAGTVINADAMQVYRELRVLTARPTAAEEARVPHALYGVRAAAAPGNAAWWREAALGAMAASRNAGRLPILCGGSGLYLRALTHGLAAIPDSGPAAREEARRLLLQLGPAGLHTRLAEADPATAARLRPSDRQRVARAWEVWRGTGRGLAAWQQAAAAAPAAWRFAAILLDPPRQPLREAIDRRWEAMLAQGALDEMRALLALRLDPGLPAMRAHGVAELAAQLRGDIDAAAAGLRVRLATAQYSKRQATWFRHHALAAADETHMIRARIAAMPQLSESLGPDLVNFIEGLG